MNDEKQNPEELNVSQGEEGKKAPEKEIDLNVLFPEETNDLNTLFPDVETRELLKKIRKNKKDIESMKQRFDEEIEPKEQES
jgi:hypothetical protein